jgi:hypothetical protein
VSLLLFVYAAVLWVRSFSIAEHWELACGRERPLPAGVRSSTPLILISVIEVISYRGHWLIQYTPGFVRRPSRPLLRREVLTNSPADIAGGIDTGIWGRGGVGKLPGLRFRSDPSGILDIGVHGCVPLVLALLLPILWVRRRRRDRATPGLCVACGYDLRATPDRCPECGAAVARAGPAIPSGT